MAKDYGPHGGSSRSNDRSHDRGGNQHRTTSTRSKPSRNQAPDQGGHSRFQPDSGYYGHTGGVNPHAGWQKDVKNIEMAKSVRPYHNLISDKATQYLPNWMRKTPNWNARTKFLKSKGLLKEIAPGKWDTEDENLSWVHDPDILTSQWGLDRLRELDYVPNSDLHGKEEGGEGGGLPYIWPYQTASAPIEEEEIVVADSGLGSGHFRVPEQYRLPAARGGVMDIEDRESIIKTPDEEIVTNQMEEIEGQTAGPQWYQDRLEHLMFLGYSYEEAGDIAYDSDAYFEAIGHDPYATGGRVGRAFGGVMDTYTGRRKYGLGSIFKKATKPIKKILKSPIGKLAAMAGLGYLATPGHGTGWQKWLKPGGKGDWWKRVLLGKETGIAPNPGERAGGVLKMLKNPWVSIPAAAGAAGLMTAKQPVEDLDNVQSRWDADKAAFDAYLASLDDEDSYRVPDEYILSAEGGRIGKQEGGLMDLGGMEKDYRNDGGFVPIGGQEKADDVPARLSRNEFVFTADAVRSAGGGDIDKGAEVMENVMKNLEAGGKVSEESQGKGGAQEMFEVSERLSEVM